MMKTRNYICLAIAILLSLTISARKQGEREMVVVAYVTSWTNEVPDATTMTRSTDCASTIPTVCA